MLQEISGWLASTSLSWAMAGGIPWLWPLCETLHFIGLALLMAVVGLLDLRMLGFAKEIPLGPLQRLTPWGILGFAINLVTGVLFFVGAPSQYVTNIAFLFKMAFIALAGVNVILFYVTGLYRHIDSLPAGADAPTAAKLIAATSLVLWMGVLFWGRMLPFIGNAF
jgi:hypothetical protein